jgi:nitroreductase
MHNHLRSSFAIALFSLFAVLTPCCAQDLAPIVLPKPRMEGGKPLMQALKERRSTREFGAEKLAPQTLSDLLWAAGGVNRAGGGRTAPSAMNSREVDLYVALPGGVYLYYVALPGGVYLYEAEPHRLSPVAAGAMAQNVYLFCASEGLITVLRASVDKDALGKILRLRPEQRITYAQSVGYPKK